MKHAFTVASPMPRWCPTPLASYQSLSSFECCSSDHHVVFQTNRCVCAQESSMQSTGVFAMDKEPKTAFSTNLHRSISPNYLATRSREKRRDEMLSGEKDAVFDEGMEGENHGSS